MKQLYIVTLYGIEVYRTDNELIACEMARLYSKNCVVIKRGVK